MSSSNEREGLTENLRLAYKLINELRQDLLVTTFPLDRARLQRALDQTRQQAEQWERDLAALDAKPPVLPPVAPTDPAIRPLKVFLCHSPVDAVRVRQLHTQLGQIGPNLQPWFSEEDLLAGQDWDYETRRALKASDVILVCLSPTSISSEGYVNKVIKLALDIADEKPQGAIFVVPLKLAECELPARLEHLHPLNYFTGDGQRTRPAKENPQPEGHRAGRNPLALKPTPLK